MSSPDILFAEAVACHQRKDYARAGQLCRQLIKRFPKEAAVLNLMGLVEMGEKRYPEAERWIRKALAIAPQVPDFHSNLGEALRNQAKLPEAIAVLEKAAEKWPESAVVWHNLGYARLNAGFPVAAVAAAEKSMALQPRVEVFYVLGTALCRLKRHAEAEQIARQGLMHDPKRAELLSLLGDALYNLRQYAKAFEAYTAASAQDPTMSTPYAMRGSICQSWGEGAKAVAFYRQAIAADPKDFAWGSSHLLNLLYQEEVAPADLFAEHRAFGERHGRASQVLARRTRPAGSRIRVGYISADFRDHAVAHFLEGLLRHHDKGAFEIFCYSDVEAPDVVTTRLATLVEHWVPVTALYNDQLARRIHADGIDILVDTAGHTSGARRLTVFSQRPAAVQVTYVGYPATTGLPAMDYRLVDAITDPQGVAEPWHTEQLVRLPGCFLSYTPSAAAPAVAPPPSSAGGGITFGSFNNIAKITDGWIGLVARILGEVPGSRCLLKSSFIGAGDGSKERFHAAFARRGIGPERVEVLPFDATEAGHLARYHEVDIALDTFPYHGTTTTCEALWMGVPVVSLAGETHVSRVGASLLACVGLPDLVAQTPDEFVHKAVGLARDPERLTTLRAGMRARMAPLTDGAAFARKLEEAYREMVRRAYP